RQDNAVSPEPSYFSEWPSSYHTVSSAPVSSEETHPSVRNMHGAAEAEVKTLARSATAVAQPVLSRLETESDQGMAVDCEAGKITDRSVEAVPGKSDHHFPITDEELGQKTLA
uniref:Uncharacterized protein n=1 Tax=Apteryx owenii TaxID=8824 RepID=A0A8B9PH13_APTOW